MTRECGLCHELAPVEAVTCVNPACRALLVMTVPDRVLAKHVGGLRPHEKRRAA